MKWHDDLLVGSRERAEALFGTSSASLQLGGTTVWSEDQASLFAAVELMQRRIEEALKSHLSLAPQVLKKLVKDSLGTDVIDDRIFSAVFGAVLRLGRADAIVCASPNDKAYRIYVGESQMSNWRRAKKLVMDALLVQGHITVRECEAILFGNRAYNTWSSSSHVLLHLSYVGAAEMVDKDSCRLVKELF